MKRHEDSPKRSGQAAERGDPAAVDRILQALGDPTRRRLLELLTGGPRSVSALAEPLGITLTAVTQHLQILEACDLARTEKVGRVRSCRIETAGLRVLERWILERRSAWERSLDRLGSMLEGD